MSFMRRHARQIRKKWAKRGRTVVRLILTGEESLKNTGMTGTDKISEDKGVMKDEISNERQDFEIEKRHR